MAISRLLLAAAAVTLSFASVGCVENESTLFIKGVLDKSGGECTVSADPGAALLANGILDRQLTATYFAALLVGNQLVQRGSATQLRTETARVALRGAEIRLTSTRQAVLEEFSVDGTGFVDPASGTSPGYGVFFATLIANAARINTENRNIIANVRVYGRTLGGREVDSGELAFPIALCEGCLISYPPEANGSSTGYDCTIPASDLPPAPCDLGQDEVVDCRLCTNTNPYCRRPGG